MFVIRSERDREDARAAVSDQQVRPVRKNYPVDRYLVESSKKNENVSIINEDIWNPEPMLNPEDEIILRKLHDMLQSTTDDLKLLSGELSKYHEPGVQVKTLPTPLDAEFNEKIHIEEIVNAKFHGYKIVGSMSPSKIVQKDLIKEAVKTNLSKLDTKIVDTGVQVNYMPTLKKKTLTKKLGTSRTRIVQIDGTRKEDETQYTVKNNMSQKKNYPSVSYNELSHEYMKPKIDPLSRKVLQIQQMPSINIRSELTTQKVLQLDINPKAEENSKNTVQSNALVISMQREPDLPKQIHNQPTIRKISKMLSHESSDSTNNISSDSKLKVSCQKQIQSSPNIKFGINQKGKKESKRHGTNLDEWKKQLNAVYGKTKPRDLNKLEYIPYSKLTLGGVNVSDIEREISHIPNRNDIVISPILDKILSRENSFRNESPQKKKILTLSDENLLQEVIDIESQVTSTLSKELNTNKSGNVENIEKANKDSDSYIDDFENDKSDEDRHTQCNSSSVKSTQSNKTEHEDLNISDEPSHNKTYTKTINLSFKNSVDIFEFVHSVDTQEVGTQSNALNKISLKQTQTSPRNDQTNLQPIHNDLWSSIDPKIEVEKMFHLEKELIKKLILDEYSDLLDENLKKPSTSKIDPESSEKNIAASAKNTQTSPAHVKSVMTSPTRTKTRTTSPVALPVKVNQRTSPMVVVSKEEDVRFKIDDDELGISVKLSSPRFCLLHPQPAGDLISNIEHYRKESGNVRPKINESSSSSLNEDYSLSDISSLGEISKKFKKKLRKSRIPSISELSSSSLSGCSLARSSTGPPFRSEGEYSAGQLISKKTNNNSKSEGEISLGQL